MNKVQRRYARPAEAPCKRCSAGETTTMTEPHAVSLIASAMARRGLGA
jgi:hypothetical protein